MNTTTPYHVEAGNLGANLRAIKAAPCPHGHWSAVQIREVWDYRARGLTADQAREHIARWTRPSYHPQPYGPEAGRILRLRDTVCHARHEHAETVRRIEGLPIASPECRPRWDRRQLQMVVAGRVIVITRHESAEWDKNSHYPTHTEVTYTSQLLREDWQRPPSVIEVYTGRAGRGYSGILHCLVEQTISHDARGKWWERAIAQLLGAEYVSQYCWDPMAGEHVVYKIIEQNGCLRSVYDPEYIYPLGEWVRDVARPQHGGGIYCYRDMDAAMDAAQRGEIFRSAWSEGKELVLCKCSARGRRLHYPGDKWAYTELRVDAVLHPIEH